MRNIDSPQKALEYKNRYGVDGIMIGRAAIGHPFIFEEVKHYFATGEIIAAPSIEQKVDVAIEHLTNSIKWKGEKLGILEMRRHYSNYLKGISHVKEIKNKIVSSLELQEILELLDVVKGMELA